SECGTRMCSMLRAIRLMNLDSSCHWCLRPLSVQHEQLQRFECHLSRILGGWQPCRRLPMASALADPFVMVKINSATRSFSVRCKAFIGGNKAFDIRIEGDAIGREQ